MGRRIEVSVEVFQKIWSLWQAEEATEDEILRRILWQLPPGTPEMNYSYPTSLSVPPSAAPTGVHETDSSGPAGPTLGDPPSDGQVNRIRGKEGNRSAPPSRSGTIRPSGRSRGKIRWVDDVCDALQLIGGEADLPEIYRMVQDIRRTEGRSLPESLEATVRQTIEAHSSDSENYEEREDYFEHVSRGRWRLR